MDLLPVVCYKPALTNSSPPLLMAQPALPRVIISSRGNLTNKRWVVWEIKLLSKSTAFFFRFIQPKETFKRGINLTMQGTKLLLKTRKQSRSALTSDPVRVSLLTSRFLFFGRGRGLALATCGHIFFLFVKITSEQRITVKCMQVHNVKC